MFIRNAFRRAVALGIAIGVLALAHSPDGFGGGCTSSCGDPAEVLWNNLATDVLRELRAAVGPGDDAALTVSVGPLHEIRRIRVKKLVDGFVKFQSVNESVSPDTEHALFRKNHASGEIEFNAKEVEDYFRRHPLAAPLPIVVHELCRVSECPQGEEDRYQGSRPIEELVRKRVPELGASWADLKRYYGLEAAPVRPAAPGASLGQSSAYDCGLGQGLAADFAASGQDLGAIGRQVEALAADDESVSAPVRIDDLARQVSERRQELRAIRDRIAGSPVELGSTRALLGVVAAALDAADWGDESLYPKKAFWCSKDLLPSCPRNNARNNSAARRVLASRLERLERAGKMARQQLESFVGLACASAGQSVTDRSGKGVSAGAEISEAVAVAPIAAPAR